MNEKWQFMNWRALALVRRDAVLEAVDSDTELHLILWWVNDALGASAKTYEFIESATNIVLSLYKHGFVEIISIGDDSSFSLTDDETLRNRIEKEFTTIQKENSHSTLALQPTERGKRWVQSYYELLHQLDE